MNKKGYFGNFVFGFIGLFVLIIILVSLMPVQTGDIEPNKTIEILENTSSRTLSQFQISEDNSVIINVVYSFIDFILYSSFEVVKAGVKYGIENPDFINAKTLLWIVMISLLAPIIYYAFMGFMVMFLLIREWVLIKRERKRFKN